MKIGAAKRLSAMAYSRSRAEDLCHDLGEEIRNHLIKVYLYPQSTHVKGWMLELRAWYRRIVYVGNNQKKKPLKFKDYYMWLYADCVSTRLDSECDVILLKNTRLKPRAFTHSEMEEVFQKVYTVICRALSQNENWDNVLPHQIEKLLKE